MTLQEIMQAVDRMSADERRQLREYIDQTKPQPNPARDLSPEEWIKRMKEAAHEIRSDFTDDEWAEVVAAMNEDYIEPVDDDLWKD